MSSEVANSTGSTRVYVGNLAWRVKWQDLKDHMRQVGEVKFVEIIEAFNGRSKGCGIVEYVEPEAAFRAQNELNDSLLFDRKIFVREDREARDAPVEGEYRGGGSGGAPRRPRQQEHPAGPRFERPAPRAAMGINEETAGRQLYVANLPWRISWRELKDIFGGQDNVERADVVSDQDGRSRGFGFVVMRSKEAAEEAIEKLNGSDVDGRPLMVKMDNGPPAPRNRDMS